MTNIRLQRLLAKYPPDWPVSVELDAITDDNTLTLQDSNIYVGQAFGLKEVLIHNSPLYDQQPQTSE